MSLLTRELFMALPPIYATDGKKDALVRARFFCPWSDWTWYPVEFDGHDQFFELVDGFEIELGYFSLAGLESLRGPGGLTIERDIHFQAVPLNDLQQSLMQARTALRGSGQGRSR